MNNPRSYRSLRQVFWSFTILLCLSSGALATLASGREPGEDISTNDLRLRLSDLRQELATTSINFSDLDPRQLRASVPGSDALSTEAPLRKFRILIDIGHGGRDLGAQGFWDASEKDLCLQIGRMVARELSGRDELRGLPVEVRLSRGSDRYLTLHERVRMANDWGADLFVSIHANASAYHRARGFEVYFLSSRATDSNAINLARFENEAQDLVDDSAHPPAPLPTDVLSMLSDAQTMVHLEESSRFAEVVNQAMSRALRAHARGVRQGPFTVLAGTSMPAILVEVGYVTNPAEARQLTSPLYRKRLASAISTGIIEFADAQRPSPAPQRLTKPTTSPSGSESKSAALDGLSEQLTRN